MPGAIAYLCLLKQMVPPIFLNKQLRTFAVVIETLKSIWRTLVASAMGDMLVRAVLLQALPVGRQLTLGIVRVPRNGQGSLSHVTTISVFLFFFFSFSFLFMSLLFLCFTFHTFFLLFCKDALASFSHAMAITSYNCYV